MGSNQNPRSPTVVPLLEAAVATYALAEAYPGDLIYSKDTGRIRTVVGTIGALALSAPLGGTGAGEGLAGIAKVLAGQSILIVAVAGMTAGAVVELTFAQAAFDATAIRLTYLAAPGQFTITTNAAATADTLVAWSVAKL